MPTQKPARRQFWIRKFYTPFVEDGSLTTVFRPGRRLLGENHPKAIDVGETVRIRIVDKVGADWANLYGVLLPAPDRPALVTSVTVKHLGEIEEADFQGSTPDVTDMNGLKLQLALIYNLSREELSPDFWVTCSTFQYLPKL
jgi:hypothetical protein